MPVESVTKHRDEILRLAHTHGASRVRMFGSHARGEADPQSDLDLLISLAPDRSLFDIVALKLDVEELLQCSVDVVTDRSLSPYLRDRVLSEAVPL